MAMMIAVVCLILNGFGQVKPVENKKNNTDSKVEKPQLTAKVKSTDTIMRKKINEYATVKLSTDMSKLTDSEKKVIGLLIDVSTFMDQIFWMQTWGDKMVLLKNLRNEDARKFAEINYGSWDRLDNNKPFMPEMPIRMVWLMAGIWQQLIMQILSFK